MNERFLFYYSPFSLFSCRGDTLGRLVIQLPKVAKPKASISLYLFVHLFVSPSVGPGSFASLLSLLTVLSVNLSTQLSIQSVHFAFKRTVLFLVQLVYCSMLDWVPFLCEKVKSFEKVKHSHSFEHGRI